MIKLDRDHKIAFARIITDLIEADFVVEADEMQFFEKIISKDGTKDKQISAKVNVKTYNAFTIINKAQGLSNNSALNMLISKYVRENRMLLEDENIE